MSTSSPTFSSLLSPHLLFLLSLSSHATRSTSIWPSASCFLVKSLRCKIKTRNSQTARYPHYLGWADHLRNKPLKTFCLHSLTHGQDHSVRSLFLTQVPHDAGRGAGQPAKMRGPGDRNSTQARMLPGSFAHSTENVVLEPLPLGGGRIQIGLP
ncbi:hypothetical protein IWX92DRAFT_376808 [Phyllosticta citricarpa]